MNILQITEDILVNICKIRFRKPDYRICVNLIKINNYSIIVIDHVNGSFIEKGFDQQINIWIKSWLKF